MTNDGVESCWKCCCFLAETPALQKKDMDMKEFESICGWILNPPFEAGPALMFSLMCASLGIDRYRADNMFYKKMGMSCEEAIEACQKGKVMF